MDKSRKYILINSILAFVSAFFITTFIHESGHFIAYLLLGADAVLYHNYVQTTGPVSSGVSIIASLAGPVSSFLQGALFGIIIFKRRKNKALDLLFLWLSLLGLVNFFGYLLLTPLSTVGDTGKVAELLQISYSLRILIAVVGVVVLIFLILKIGKFFTNFIPLVVELTARRKYVNQILLFSILIGSAINVVFSFPIPVALNVIYPATSSFVVMSSFGVVLKTPTTTPNGSEILKRISWLLLALFVIGIAGNRLLTLGIG